MKSVYASVNWSFCVGLIMDSTAGWVRLPSCVYMCSRAIYPVQNECIKEICQEMDLHKNILQITHKRNVETNLHSYVETKENNKTHFFIIHEI